MEHRKPEWMLEDLLGGLCISLGQRFDDFNLGGSGWRWNTVRGFKRYSRGRMDRIWRWIGCGDQGDRGLRLLGFLA